MLETDTNREYKYSIYDSTSNKFIYNCEQLTISDLLKEIYNFDDDLIRRVFDEYNNIDKFVCQIFAEFQGSYYCNVINKQ